MPRKLLLGTLIVLLSASLMAAPDWRLQLRHLALKEKPSSLTMRHKQPAFSRSRTHSLSRKASGGAREVTKSRARGAEPRLFMWDGTRYRFATIEETRNIDRQAVARFNPILEATELLRTGQLARARTMLEPHLHEEGVAEFAATTLSEVCLHEGNYAEALGLIGPYLSAQSDESDSLIAAVAGAMTGNVFPGQADYCRQVIARQAGGVQNLSFAAPSDNGFNASQVCALLAFAALQSMHNNDAAASRFYQRALNLAPDNALANFELGEIAYRAHRWSDAEARFHASALHSVGDYRDVAAQRERDAHYLGTHSG